MKLLSYHENWKDIEIGDHIIAESLTSGVVGYMSVVNVGAIAKWKVIEKTHYSSSRGYFWVGKGWNGRMVFCEDDVGEDDIQVLKPSLGMFTGLTLKMYIRKKRRPLRAIIRWIG